MALLLKRVRIPLLCNQIEIEGEEERKEDSPSFSRLGLKGKDEGEILSDRMPTELKCSEDVVRVLDFCRKTVDGEPSLSPDFDIEKFEACLSKAEPPTPMPESEENQSSLWNVLAGRQVASTQTILSENASKLPSKCIVIADRQTQGKGRAGNKWISPPGCLMCSILCNLSIEGHKLPLLQYATTLAVVQALEELCGSGADSGNPVGAKEPKFARIKWPNDIYIDGTKIGGVLCQTVYKGSGKFQLIAGIGLNIDNMEPTFCVNQVLRTSNKPEISREQLLASVLPRLLQLYGVICKDSFIPLHEEYYSYWLHAGQKLKVKGDASIKDKTMEMEMQEEMDVVVTGLSKDGFLLAKDEFHGLVELYPDGNSLDLMSGLICKKTTR